MASQILAPGVTLATSADQVLPASGVANIFIVNGDAKTELAGGVVYVQLKRSTGEYSTVATLDDKRYSYMLRGPATWRVQRMLTGTAIGVQAEVGSASGAGGPQPSAGSTSVTPATDAIFTVGGVTSVASQSFARPADTTAYAAGDLVANNTTAANVTPPALVVGRVAAGSGILRRLRLFKSSTSLVNAQFRLHLFRDAAPTVSNGDNGVLLSSGVGNYLGRADITMDQAFTDGAWGSTDLLFTDMQFKLTTGQSIYALIEARAAYTPASGETFTIRAEVIQD